MFLPLKFEKLNESDIREEVIAPLLRALGYRSGTENNIIREQSLRYPRTFLGRKKPERDPLLRGRADYILEVNRRLRWIIEAKAPDASVTVDDVEQAWTYASHPEVRALYFVVCNGISLVVYRTHDGPNCPPILSIPYERLDADFDQLQSLVAPDSLIRDFPEVKPDFGPPIAPGLRSVARITNGLIRYETSDVGVAVLSELQNSIEDGAIERATDGTLIAFMRVLGPSRSLQELNERLGFSKFEMISDSESLSVDPENPTTFTYDNQLILPAGEELPDLLTWQKIKLSQNISCLIHAEASGFFHEGRITGKFSCCLHYREFAFVVNLSGTFYLHVV